MTSPFDTWYYFVMFLIIPYSKNAYILLPQRSTYDIISALSNVIS